MARKTVSKSRPFIDWPLTPSMMSTLWSISGHRWPLERPPLTNQHPPLPHETSSRSKCQPLPCPIEDRLGIIYHRKRLPPFRLSYPRPPPTNVMKFGKFSIIEESNLTAGRDTQGSMDGTVFWEEGRGCG